MIIKDHHEPIISRELFDKANRILDEKSLSQEGKTKHSNCYPFSGKIKCGRCGASYVARFKNRKDGSRYKAWRCYEAAINTKEIPDNITDRNEQLEYLLRPHGIMRRTVTLSKGWYKDATGAMLGIRKSDGMVVALIPAGFSGYRYRDMETGKHVKINGKNQELFEEEAIAFYKPLPLKELGISDLMRYILVTLSPADFVMTGASALAVTLIYGRYFLEYYHICTVAYYG